MSVGVVIYPCVLGSCETRRGTLVKPPTPLTTAYPLSIGNAVLSKYPLDDLEQITFTNQCCRYGGRWGGRSAVKASISFNSTTVTVISTHLESGQSDIKSVLNGTYVRERQAAELSTKFANPDAAMTIIGGDFNSPLRSVDPTRLR